jgi:antitoxin component YwqK of YwqJK toxin-antitoxin module
MIRLKPIILFALAAITATLAIYTYNPPARPAALTAPEVPLGRLTLREGRLYRGLEKTSFNGTVVEYYPNHVLKSRAEVVSGKLHGVSEGWHTNGVLQVREHFFKGVSHGERVKWHANGKKQSLAEIVNGKIDGLFRRWNEDGTIAEEIEMKNGKPQGLSQAYYPSGFVKKQVRLDKDAVIEEHAWKDGEKKNN